MTKTKMTTKGKPKYPKADVWETAQRSRILAMSGNVSERGGLVWAVRERVAVVDAADGKRHVVALSERGRSVEMTGIGLALLSCFIDASNALAAHYEKELADEGES